MAEIRLKGGEIALVDDADFDLVRGLSWYAGPGGKYATARIEKGVFVRMHRLILDAKPGEIVDHANRDTFDNRRANIRICSPSQNMYNRAMNRTNKSGFKGVYPKRGLWCAEIRFGGKKIRLGYFNNPEVAHQAYCAAAKRLHGEFARTA